VHHAHCGTACRYSTKTLKFAEIDVARWSEAAKEFNIDTGGMSLQIPSVILFENCKEHSRLPPFKPDGTVAPTKLDKVRPHCVCLCLCHCEEDGSDGGGDVGC